MPSSYDFATIRVVPRVDREEFINAGVILFCLERKFLNAKIQVNEPRLKALWPELDVEAVRQHLEAFPRVCVGEPGAGPVGLLTVRERFHWLVSPRSTVIQVSPVHSGLCDEPAVALADLFQRKVLVG